MIVRDRVGGQTLTGPFAGSSPALGTKQFTTEDYARARDRYKPDKVIVLFIAESPPSSGGYFYFSQTIGKDHLFRETMKALELWPLSRPMGKGLDKRPFLAAFHSKGFFLIDTCELPVDKLPPAERRNAIVRGADRIVYKVKHLDPTNIVIVKKTVFHPIREALEKAGLRAMVLNKAPLPFPSHGNQQKFRDGLRHALKKRALSQIFPKLGP
jgi:hypothetical protein